MGMDVTVMVRSMLLRGFDRECVDKIGAYMEHHGTNFSMGAQPTRFVQGTEKAVGCHFTQGGAEKYEEYDTVLLAIGRTGEAAKLGLANAGVWFDERNGKVEAVCERTNVPNIYCIGDMVQNRIELTPVAKMAGKKVVRRLGGETSLSMNYFNVATTVFTPLEYGMVGYTQDEALEKFGEDGMTVITKVAKPLEWALSPGRDNDANKAFFKVIVQNSNNKIIGFHMLGPNAGEVLQGVSVAVRAGATKEDLDECIGIHPTTAEYMTMMSGVKIAGIKCET
jgi:thioredoxin reductase (NADPH)